MAHPEQKLAGGLHLGPTDPVDARHSRHQKGVLNFVEFSNDDLGVLAGHTGFVQKTAKIDKRHDAAVSIGKGALDAGMTHLRHGRHRLLADDFHHFGNVDAVISPVSALFIDEEFDDFQFVGAHFQ